MPRLLELLASLALATGLAAWLSPPQWGTWALCLSTLAGALVWWTLDSWRAQRLLRWLYKGEHTEAPRLPGVWGQITDNARKSFKKLHRKSQKSENRLQEFLAAIQASPNGVTLIDARGAIEWCNLTVAQQLGFDTQRDVGQLVPNLVRDPLFTAYLAKGDFRHEIQIDGREANPGHPHRISIQIHPYSKGRKLMLTRDVTALELAETMRRDFVANVSHEIRTPLTVLSGFVETMMHLPLPEEDRQRYLGLMNQQAQRMQTLVSDLLTLSRLEGSPAPGLSDWTSSSDLLDEVVQEAQALSHVIVGGEHQFEKLPSPVFDLACARSEVLSALSNLMSNAVRYTPAGGTIQAGWRTRADGGVEFFVTDTGPGIDAEHLPRLTERFYRVDRSRSRETGGTGLGLAIVKHVAQRHGGQVQVESTLGRGSTFRVLLPAVRVKPISTLLSDA